MLKCESCDLEFDNHATLLRHVSHKKVCKLHYGEDRVQDMKIEGKLESKRKWWKSHANEAKKAYKLNKKEICQKEKQKYVKYDQRFKTDEGVAFHEFYRLIYDAREESALDNLKKSEFVSYKVHKIAEDKAIDKVFEAEPSVFCNQDKHPQFCKYFAKDTDKEDFDEEEYPAEIEKAMEEAFEKLLEKQIEIEMKNWMDVAKKQLKDKCSRQCWESAFKMYFRDFSTTLFPSIQDKSIDLAFAKFDETTDDMNITEETWRDEEIQELLERKYEAVLRDESRKAAIDCEMSFKLSERIESKMEKQVRAMKRRE